MNPDHGTAAMPITSGRMQVQQLKRRAAALLLCAFTMAASAISPLTPRLSPATHADLLGGLARAGLPDVAHNSVVLAITHALGFEAVSGPIVYATAYAHLPTVRGRVTRVSEACSRVEAEARLPKQAEAEAIAIEGTYCLLGPAEWASSRQVVRKLHR
jgi:hypothetical protein